MLPLLSINNAVVMGEGSERKSVMGWSVSSEYTSKSSRERPTTGRPRSSRTLTEIGTRLAVAENIGGCCGVCCAQRTDGLPIAMVMAVSIAAPVQIRSMPSFISISLPTPDRADP